MRCKKCGQALSRGQSVCPSCGTSMAKQIRRTRNLRRMIVIVLLIVLLTAALLGFNLHMRNELPDLSFQSIRSLFSRKEEAPKPLLPNETPAPVEEPETPEPVEEPEATEPVDEPVSAIPADDAAEAIVPVVPEAAEEETRVPVEATPEPVEETPAPVELAPPVPAQSAEPASALAKEPVAEQTPLERYRAVETASFERAVELLCARYDTIRAQALRTEARPVTLHSDLRLGSLGRKLVTAFFGESMSWLNALSLDVDSRAANALEEADFAAALNGVSLMRAQCVSDLEGDIVTVLLPELSDQPFTLSGKDVNRAVAAALPTGEELMALLEKYFALALQNIDVVEAGSDTLEAEGILARYDTLTVLMDDAAYRRMLSAVIGELRWDETVRGYVADIADAAGASPDALYERFLTWLDEKDYALSASPTGEGAVRMVLYVDENGVIHGRSVQYMDAQRSCRLSAALPRDGERFGLELLYADGDTRLELAGRGNAGGDLLGGEFVLRSNTERLARISLSKEADGLDLTVIPTPSVYAERFPEALRDDARDLSLTLRAEGDEAAFALELGLLQGEDEAIVWTAVQAPGEDAAIVVPEDAIDGKDWASALTADSFDLLLGRLKEAGAPNALRAELRSALLQAFTSLGQAA